MVEKLSETARAQALPELAATGWNLEDDRDAIRKTFTFKNFVDAFGWMTRAAIWAEKWNHHPEWFNVWNRVDVVLTTHDADGLSDADIKLEKKMDSLA